MPVLRIKKGGLILVIGLLIILSANKVFAGFGVSPPKVLNHYLKPGSHFEQVIHLVQSKPKKDLLVKIEINAPEIEKWISIDKGFEFTIPAGVQHFPIKVVVDVPEDAEFKHYGGAIEIKTLPVEKGEGMVTVALGAEVAFDLEVVVEEVYGFVIRGVSIDDIQEGRPVKVGINLQNVGNTRDRPTEIHLDIYDNYHNKLLYSGNVIDLGYVEPFETKTVIAKFKAKLIIGSYWAEIKAYKDENILVEDKRLFYVVERTGFYKIVSLWYTWVILVVVLILTALVLKKKEEIKKKLKELLKRKR